jgi:autotransporter-associated beta strand protein
VQLTGGASGFSAYAGPVTVALGGLAAPASLVWGTTFFSPSPLVLNYNSANSVLTVLNALDLNGTNREISVNAGTANLNAAISDSTGRGVGLTKGGAGALNLNGTNTYTGTTTVTSGTLGGSGSLAGPLSVQSGAILNPGGQGGNFAVSNSITLSGSLLMVINETNSPNCDLLAASTIQCGGALIVTNLGPALTNHATFRLFAGVLTGGFSASILPPLGPNLVWSNSLAANGKLTVVSTAATNPPNLDFRLSSDRGTVQFTWPPDHAGWWLEVQTNSSGAGLGTNWCPVANSFLTNQFVKIIQASGGAVFFRLAAP